MTTDRELTDLTAKTAEATGTRFCYKCAAHRPLLGGQNCPPADRAARLRLCQASRAARRTAIMIRWARILWLTTKVAYLKCCRAWLQDAAHPLAGEFTLQIYNLEWRLTQLWTEH